jgi:RNA 2',3'-cyclic 3'-phosphodiesterase
MPQLMRFQQLPVASSDVHDMFYSIMDRKASIGGRLFLAALPDTITAARILRLAGALKRAHGFSGKLIAPDRLHVSLFFLGGLQQDMERAAREAAGEMRMAPFQVSFDRTASFRGRPGSRPFVLVGGDGVGQLKSFRQGLGAGLVREGLRGFAGTSFEPHVTLLYDARGVDEYPLAEPISWTVDEIVLIQSRSGHTHLAKWRLRA